MKKFLLVLIGLILGVAVIGYMLPVGHTVSRHMVVSEPAETVWITITDFAKSPEWRRDIGAAIREESADGNVLWTEVYEGGDSLTFRTRIDQPRQTIERTIVNEDLAFGGSWTFELDSTGTGSELTITEHGEVYNPIFRFLSRFVFGHETNIERYLADLKIHLES